MSFKRFIARGLLALSFMVFQPFSYAQSIQLFSNNASTQTTTAVTTGSATVTVTTGMGSLFPALSGGNWFIATLETLASGLVTSQEIVKVTARSGDTFTIVRAQEGTIAQTFPIGSTIALLPTAGGLAQFQQASQVQSGATNFAVDSGSANAYAVSLNPALTAHVVGAPIRFLAGHANTGASTFSDGVGAAALVTPAGNSLPANAIVNGSLYQVAWNGTNFTLMSTSSATGLIAANNLSDVANVSTSLGNLGGAPLASPALTGTPTAPTASVGGGSNQIATTLYTANVANPGASVIGNGYQKLFSGLTLEWGAVICSSGGSTITLPHSVTTILNIELTAIGSTGTSILQSYNASGNSFVCSNASSDSTFYSVIAAQ